MDAHPPADMPPDGPRRRFGQFSLLWLLAIVILGCLAAAWYGENLRRRQTEETLRKKEAENRELRVAIGILDDDPQLMQVTDKEKVYVRGIPGFDERQWRWWLYLPPGKDWDIRVTQGDRYDEENQQYWEQDGGTSLKGTGEFTLEARITRDREGRAFVEFEQFRKRSGFFIPEPSAAVLEGNGKVSAKLTGQGNPQVFDGDGPFELLRYYREVETKVPSTGETRGVPRDGWGISIQIEERTHKMERFKKMREQAGR